MDELISIVQNIWDFVCDIIDSMSTFLQMLWDSFDSVNVLMSADFFPEPLTICLIVLFSTGIVKALLSLGSSNV